MNTQELTGIAMTIIAGAGLILDAANKSAAAHPPPERHGPHRKPPKTRPLTDAATTDDTTHSRKARALRFIRANPVSFVMAIAQLSYLAWVAASSGPPSRVLVVIVAVIVADLHATVILWMLGGGDRTLGQIVGGDTVLPVDDGV